MFQPWLGIATILGSVDIVTSYLNTPSHHSIFSGSIPFILRVPTPPSIRHPDTELHHSSHPIYHPHYVLGPPVQTSVHSHRPPPPVLHSLYFRPQPAPQVPIGPCSTAPRSRYGRFYNICCLFTYKLTNSETY